MSHQPSPPGHDARRERRRSLACHLKGAGWFDSFSNKPIVRHPHVASLDDGVVAEADLYPKVAAAVAWCQTHLRAGWSNDFYLFYFADRRDAVLFTLAQTGDP